MEFLSARGGMHLESHPNTPEGNPDALAVSFPGEKLHLRSGRSPRHFSRNLRNIDFSLPAKYLLFCRFIPYIRLFKYVLIDLLYL
jgi:hypothetical protein